MDERSDQAVDVDVCTAYRAAMNAEGLDPAAPPDPAKATATTQRFIRQNPELIAEITKRLGRLFPALVGDELSPEGFLAIWLAEYGETLHTGDQAQTEDAPSPRGVYPETGGDPLARCTEDIDAEILEATRRAWSMEGGAWSEAVLDRFLRENPLLVEELRRRYHTVIAWDQGLSLAESVGLWIFKHADEMHQPGPSA